jgi:hypothetical protein
MPTGDVNFDPVFILRHYASTWLILDVFIVASDWLEVLVLSSSKGSDLTGVARIFRIVRIVRLVRLFRIGRLLKMVAQTDFAEKIQSTLSLTMSVVALLLCVFSFSHAIACVWWAIGDGQRGKATWVTEARYDEVGVDAQYLVALHWSLSQFSGGMDEVAPQNTLERSYAVVIWQIAFMAAALIVSILTSNLTQQHITNAGQMRQMNYLTKYLNQNDISSGLMLRVQRSAQHAISGELSEDTVDLLAVISEPLKIEMHWEIYSPMFHPHAFFHELMMEVPYLMHKICHHATSALILQEGDVAFRAGEIPSEPRMYIVAKGSLEYLCTSLVEPKIVHSKACLAEGTLWTTWMHYGTLTAIDDAKLVAVDAANFQDIISRSPKDFSEDGVDPRAYAADFVHRLNQSSEVNDLPVVEVKGQPTISRRNSFGIQPPSLNKPRF